MATPRHLSAWPVIWPIMLAAACTGDDGGPGAGRSLAGIWTGTSISNVRSETLPVTALITSTGSARLVFTGTDGRQFAGDRITLHNPVSASLTAYAEHGNLLLNGAETGAVELRGSFTHGAVFSGQYSGNADSGSFSFTFAPANDRDPQLGLLSGNWSQTDAGTGRTTTLSMVGDGEFNGSDTAGCVYNGSLTVISPGLNIFAVTLSVSGCGRAGGYTGLVAMTDRIEQNDTLVVGISNATDSLTHALERQ